MPFVRPQTKAPRGLILPLASLALLAACDVPFDADLRSFGEGFSTTEAALNAAERPRPDANGIISYPNFQVVVAQQGDTVRSISTRLGLNAEEVARYNGINPDTTLRSDEIVALPSRVPTSAAPGTGTIQPGTMPAGSIDVASVAGAAIDRAGPVTTTALAPTAAAATPAAAPAPPVPAAGPEPIRHQVMRGETAFSIARLYDVPARSLADWNGLGPDLAVREGQYLLIPTAGGAPPPRAPETVPAPGAGSATPVPPSASTPLPEERPEPPASVAATAPPPSDIAPDLGAQQSAPARASDFIRPVEGAIIRGYAPGRNEGIAIGAPAGTDVRAAAAGTVAAITRNTDGVQIVVIRHADNLLTVYTHLDSLTIQRDQSVTQGQAIGKVAEGDPSFLHFEVRRGMESVDPLGVLP